jgi:hypothetical protein
LPAGFPTKIPYALLCPLVFEMHYVYYSTTCFDVWFWIP